MDLRLIRDRLDHERRTLVRDGETIEISPHVTRLRAPDGAYHVLIYSWLTSETADFVIAEQVKHYRALGAGFEWKVYAHDPPSDLRDRLARHGFAVGPLEAVLVLDVRTAPGWVEETAPCEIVRVERADQVGLFREAAEEIFDKDYALTSDQLAQAIESGSTEHVAYMAVVDGRAVSVGRLYTHADSHFGGLYGGGTRAAYRGRGLYRALVAARARDARSLGARYLIVDALPTRRPILQRLGFQHLADTWACEWSPGRSLPKRRRAFSGSPGWS